MTEIDSTFGDFNLANSPRMSIFSEWCPASKRLLMFAGSFLVFFYASFSQASDDSEVNSHRLYQDVVQPYITTYCVKCHNSDKHEGQLDITNFSASFPDVERYGIWESIGERLKADEMPPMTEPNQPSSSEKDAVLRWLRELLDREAEQNSGDPGIVLPRRLSNSEFDYTIRDLTGVDLRAAREFPIDPANESGFDNSGESLRMSPALLAKYHAAANGVAEHLVLTRNGFVFAPKSLVTDNDRDEFCSKSIIDFYVRHEVDYADYFCAAWEFLNRTWLGESEATIEEVASRPQFRLQRSKLLQTAPRIIEDAGAIESSLPKSPLSAKYLKIIVTALQTPESLGPMAEVQARWKRILDLANEGSATFDPQNRQDGQPSVEPRPAGIPPWKYKLRAECESLREFVIQQRFSLNRYFEPIQLRSLPIRSVPLLSTDSQLSVTWYNQEHVVRRMSYAGKSDNPQLDAARDRFCKVFPNTFAVTGRQRYLVTVLQSPKIPLSAGFNYQHGFFRDDGPLCQLVLSDEDRAELDDLWLDLKYITRSPYRQFMDFLWHDRGEPPAFIEGPEFNFARPENQDVTRQSNLDRLRDLYVAKLSKLRTTNPKTVKRAIEAAKTFFTQMSAELRWLERENADSEPRQREALLPFAERAFRRPIDREEKKDLLAFYQELRDENGLTHEEAIRDSVVSILMSPKTCYRFERIEQTAGLTPLTDFELASRLSYFLWASMPDSNLLENAASGQLHNRPVLKNQIRRMLRDDRLRGFVTEFAGQWLDFRRFEEHNAVDREKFPAFTDSLRQSMFEEPLRLLAYIAQENRPILELLDADYTFVNSTLASHYELTENKGDQQLTAEKSRWTRFDHIDVFGRGGLPTMAVFLTQSSPGLRTSPVKRGHWVVSRLLGERIPPPPPNVPELPTDETATGELSLAQLLARHRSNSACSGCHQRFDPIGIVFEGYGPVGERREKDLAGRPVETQAVFPDGTHAAGIRDLKLYLRKRQDEFIKNFSRKLLSYALNRSLIPSDRSLIDQMQENLIQNEYRFESLVETIVTSSQFLNKRGQIQQR